MARFEAHDFEDSGAFRPAWPDQGSAMSDRRIDLGSGSGLKYITHSDFESCEAEWRAFEAQSISTPFQSVDWLKCWWQAYLGRHENPRLELCLIFAYDEDALVIILPMVIEPHKITRRLSWLCWELSDYNGPVIDRDFLYTLEASKIDQLWGDVLSLIPGIDFLFLAKQPIELGGASNPFHGYRAHDYRLQYHSARIMGDWQTYYTGRRTGKSRSRLRSKARYMNEKAGMVIRECFEGEDRANIVMTTIDWKRAQVMQMGAIDPFGDIVTGPFFENFSRNTNLAEEFRVFSAEVDGQPIACAFGLMSEDGFILYQTAYEAGEYGRYSPGVLLLIHMMEKIADEGHQIFDFSIGDEGYKFDWADGHYDLSLSLRANSLKGWVAGAIVKSKLNLKGWIKSSDKRFAMAKAINRHIRRLTGR